MTDQYEQRFRERIDRLCPGAAGGLSKLEDFPEAAAEAVLREILETGCLSQNAANIEAARRAVRQLPRDWMAAHLPRVLPLCLFQEPEWQEWEFRRAAELLQGAFPEALASLAEYAKHLHNPEIDEAVREYLSRSETEDIP